MNNNLPIEPYRQRGFRNTVIVASGGMTLENLTAILAERVMGWRVCPDRFVTGNRCWVRRGEFRPTECLQDAQKVLDAIRSTEYSMGSTHGKLFWARIRIDSRTVEASARSLALAICLAVAKAVGIEVRACH